MKNEIISVDDFAVLYSALNYFVETNPTVKDAYLSVFEKLSKKSKTSKRFAVLLPTGMGKTAVANSIIARMNYNKSEGVLDRQVIFITPQDTINDQLIKKLKDNGLEEMVIVMTYSALTAKLKSGDIGFFKNTELIILDELHRTGAKGWNKDLNKILDVYPNISLLGLTATELRYLDGCRDMTKEWGMDVVYKKSIEDAWNEKLMKAPTYVMVDEKPKEHILEMMNNSDLFKSNSPKVGLAKEKVNSLLNGLTTDSNSVSRIFHKYLYENKAIKKLIVFHDSIEESEQSKKSMEKYLKDAGYTKIRFFVANSKIGKAKSLENTREFSKPNDTDTLWVMMSINMHNEGLHVEGTHAEIQYRHTYSRNIFLQQIGRVMSPDDRAPKPIVIDFVNNFVDSATIVEPDYLDNILGLTRKPEDFSEEERKELEARGVKPEDFCLELASTELTEFTKIANNLRKELLEEEKESKEEINRKLWEMYLKTGDTMSLKDVF